MSQKGTKFRHWGPTWTQKVIQGGPREPKWPQKAPKGAQKEAPGVPKGPQGAQRVPPGRPKGPQRPPKDHQKALKMEAL